MDDTQKLEQLLARVARIEEAISQTSSQIAQLVQVYNHVLQETYFSQAAYLGVDVAGPYKSDQYRY